MTLPMILALAVLVIMIVLIMTDALPFGAPPLVACLLLVVFGLSTVPEAFAGFVNSSVLMIAFFMVPLAAMQKTRVISRVKKSMGDLVQRGGYKSYALLLVVVMLGASLAGTGATGYYVLILALVATIPYQKKLPTSKLMMPLGFATNHPLAPINVALIYGVMVTVLEASGYTEGVSMVTFALVNLVMSLAFLAWALVAYRLLPDHPIAEPAVDQVALRDEELAALPAWKENVTVAMFAISVIAMMMMNVIGNLAYVVPGLAAFVLLYIKMVDFREFRENLFAPVILMMAGVIGVADALAKTGLTALVGDSVAGLVGSSVPPFVLVLLFALLTSTASTFTGSNLGSVAIFAPIAIATFVALDMNPVAVACAVAISGWNGSLHADRRYARPDLRHGQVQADRVLEVHGADVPDPHCGALRRGGAVLPGLAGLIYPTWGGLHWGSPQSLYGGAPDFAGEGGWPHGHQSSAGRLSHSLRRGEPHAARSSHG